MSDRREVIAIITADSKQLDPELVKGKRKFKKWSKEVAITVKQGFSSLSGIIGLGGLAGLAAAGRQVFDFQKRLVRLRINSSQSARTIKDLEQAVFQLAKQKGLDPEDVLGGAEKFTELTGDLPAFISGMDQLSTVVEATGASFADISESAATLQQQLGVGPKEWGLAFDVIARGGKQGAVELKNMAAELSGVLPLFKQFGAKGMTGVAEISALFQMTKQGFHTASEAATGLQSLMGSIIKRSGKMKARGINIFDKAGKPKDLYEIINLIAAKAPKIEQVQDLLKDREAVRAFIAIRDAGKDMFNDLSDQSKALGIVQKDAKIWEDSPAKKMAAAQARMAEVFNEKFAANITSIANAMGLLAEMLAQVMDHLPEVLALMAASKLGTFGGLAKILGKTSMGGGAAASIANIASQALGGSGGALGKMGMGERLGMLGLAATAGYELGTVVNEWLGLSDKVSDALIALGGDGMGAARAMAQIRDKLEAQVRDQFSRQGFKMGNTYRAQQVRGAVQADRAARIQALLRDETYQGLTARQDQGAGYYARDKLGLMSVPGGEGGLGSKNALLGLLSSDLAAMTQAATAAATVLPRVDSALGGAMAKVKGPISPEAATAARTAGAGALAAAPGMSQQDLLRMILLELRKQNQGARGASVRGDDAAVARKRG